MFSMGERSERNGTEWFDGTKVCEAEEVIEYFISPKIEYKIFGWCVNYVICSLNLRNISCSSENILWKYIVKSWQYII